MNANTRPLLVLDLDETLVHCSDVPFKGSTPLPGQGHLAIRDGAVEFIKHMHVHFDLMLWSNSGYDYIQDVIATFWPKDVPLVDIFTSLDSSLHGENGLAVPLYKNMKKIVKRHQHYALDRIIGLDDKPITYKNNYGNLLAVPAFTGTPDGILGQAGAFLEKISSEPSFRRIEKRYWRNSSVCRATVAEPAMNL